MPHRLSIYTFSIFHHTAIKAFISYVHAQHIPSHCHLILPLVIPFFFFKYLSQVPKCVVHCLIQRIVPQMPTARWIPYSLTNGINVLLFWVERKSNDSTININKAPNDCNQVLFSQFLDSHSYLPTAALRGTHTRYEKLSNVKNHKPLATALYVLTSKMAITS